MLIFSQDKKSVIDAKILYVQRNLGGGKDGKFMISACAEGMGMQVVAAVFADEKNALDTLEKAYRAFSDGAASYSF